MKARDAMREVMRDVLGAISITLLAVVLLLVGVIVTERRADAEGGVSHCERGCQCER